MTDDKEDQGDPSDSELEEMYVFLRTSFRNYPYLLEDELKNELKREEQ